jgi:hypothetical protein
MVHETSPRRFRLGRIVARDIAPSDFDIIRHRGRYGELLYFHLSRIEPGPGRKTFGISCAIDNIMKIGNVPAPL